MAKKQTGPEIHCPYHKLVDPAKLKPHPTNPNTHPPGQVTKLAEIIAEHGIRWPIVVSKLSSFIVAGHCRRLAAIELGIKEYPVVIQSFKSKSEELAVLVADNKIQELSVTDRQVMADIVVELDQYNYPLEYTGLDPLEIESYVIGPTWLPDGSIDKLDGTDEQGRIIVRVRCFAPQMNAIKEVITKALSATKFEGWEVE